MTLKEVNEVQHEMYRIADELSKGNWIPFAMVTLLLGIVVVLLMHIYNTRLKGIDTKHSSHDEMLKALTDSNIRLDKMLEVHDVEIKHIKQK